MSNFEVLKINFKNIENDFRNNNVDVYVAKIELESIITKLMIMHNKQNQFGVVELEIIETLFNAKKLLEEVTHEIATQEKEEFLINNI